MPKASPCANGVPDVVLSVTYPGGGGYAKVVGRIAEGLVEEVTECTSVEAEKRPQHDKWNHKRPQRVGSHPSRCGSKVLWYPIRVQNRIHWNV